MAGRKKGKKKKKNHKDFFLKQSWKPNQEKLNLIQGKTDRHRLKEMLHETKQQIPLRSLKNTKLNTKLQNNLLLTSNGAL